MPQTFGGAIIREIANAEKINETYVGRVLRLTLLAPELIEAIVGGRQPAELRLDDLMRRFPVGWREQRAGGLQSRHRAGENNCAAAYDLMME